MSLKLKVCKHEKKYCIDCKKLNECQELGGCADDEICDLFEPYDEETDPAEPGNKQ